jgi:hypothetical protein
LIEAGPASLKARFLRCASFRQRCGVPGVRLALRNSRALSSGFDRSRMGGLAESPNPALRGAVAWGFDRSRMKGLRD